MKKKVEFTERDFFKEPFNKSEIEKLLKGKQVSEMFNFRSPGFKKTGLDRDNLTNTQLIKLMLEDPRFIRRPVVKIGRKIYFGADSKVLAETLK